MLPSKARLGQIPRSSAARKFIFFVSCKYDVNGSLVRAEKSFMKDELRIRFIYFRTDTFAILKSWIKSKISSVPRKRFCQVFGKQKSQHLCWLLEYSLLTCSKKYSANLCFLLWNGQGESKFPHCIRNANDEFWKNQNRGLTGREK